MEGRYNLQIGMRRLAAAKMAGLEKIPAIILDGPLGAEDSLAVRLVENIHREDMDPIDEAEAYAALREMGVKVSEIAKRVGKERTYVSHSMRLLGLHPKVREAVRQKNIPREHALTLLKLEPEQQLELAREVMEGGLTTVEARDRVMELLGEEAWMGVLGAVLGCRGSLRTDFFRGFGSWFLVWRWVCGWLISASALYSA